MQPSSSGSTSNDRRSPSSLAASQQESEAFPVLEGTLDSPLRQNLSQHFSAPPFLSSQERRCINREMSLSLRKQQVREQPHPHFTYRKVFPYSTTAVNCCHNPATTCLTPGHKHASTCL